MLFTDVVSGDTQGVGSMKKWTPPKWNAIFMSFTGVHSGDTEGVGSMKKGIPSKRNAIFHVI